jgi:hypothetical protein
VSGRMTEIRELTLDELNVVTGGGAGVNTNIQNVDVASHDATIGGGDAPLPWVPHGGGGSTGGYHGGGGGHP